MLDVRNVFLYPVYAFQDDQCVFADEFPSHVPKIAEYV